MLEESISSVLDDVYYPFRDKIHHLSYTLFSSTATVA